MNSNPICVGIIGQGRSGWDIHVKYLSKVPELFTIGAVADIIADRADQSAAEIGCRAYHDAESLIADPDIDLVIVATFNPDHARHAIMALNAGKHVLCEKPFGLTVADVDAMAAAARKAGKVVLPFQQRHYEKDFQKVREICDSGILGDIVLVRLCRHSFGRRWDWQTSRAMAGGNLNNNGPHLVDHAMSLFGDVDPDEVWAEAGGYLRSGDAEDHLRFILRGKGRPTVEAELSNVWACPCERWTVVGTRGGLHGSLKHLEWKWTDFSKLPARPLDLTPTPDRKFNSENLEWQTASWADADGEANLGGGATPPMGITEEFYRNFRKVLDGEAAPTLSVDEARRRVRLMERIREAAGFPAVGLKS